MNCVYVSLVCIAVYYFMSFIPWKPALYYLCILFTVLLSWQHTPRVIGEIPDPNDATLDHGRLSSRLFIIILIMPQLFSLRPLVDLLLWIQHISVLILEPILFPLYRYKWLDYLMSCSNNNCLVIKFFLFYFYCKPVFFVTKIAATIFHGR